MASTLTVDNIQGATSADKVDIPGHVLQVKSGHLNTAVSTTSTSFADISNLTATITPTSTSSKILINVDLGIVSTSTSNAIIFRLMRGSTEIGAATGATNENCFIYVWPGGASVFHSYANHFLDSPSTTSATTYKLQWKMTGSTDTGYINRRNTDNYGRTSSNFTVMEIGG